MENKLEVLKECISLTDHPMPVISVSSLEIRPSEFAIFTGSFCLKNMAEGLMMGNIGAQIGYVCPETTSFRGKDLKVAYSLRSEGLAAGRVYEDLLIISYNGGEILIPVKIIIEKPIKSSNHRLIKKKASRDSTNGSLRIYTDRQNYGVDEAGFLTFENPQLLGSFDVEVVSDEQCLQFKKTSCHVEGSTRLEFSIKVGRLDRVLGRIPIKTHPEVPLKFAVIQHQGSQTVTREMAIILTGMSGCESKEIIASQGDYRRLLVKLARMYRDIIFSGELDFEAMLPLIRGAIRYNRTDLHVRLLYIYVNLLQDRKRTALDEIKNLDQFMIYFDQKKPWISELLQLYMACLSGGEMKSVISSWQPAGKSDFLKILLKNRVMDTAVGHYVEYRKLYDMGVRSSLLMIEAVDDLNRNPILPYDADPFYKMLLKWALRHRFLYSRWLKVVLAGMQTLLRNNLADSAICEMLYEQNPVKQVLHLLGSCYVREGNTSLEALETYERVLAERLRVEGVELSFIKTAWRHKKRIDMERLKIGDMIHSLDPELKAFSCMNLFLSSGRESLLCREYLSGREAAADIYGLYLAGFMDDTPRERLMPLVHRVIRHLPVQAVHLVNEIYVQKGYYDEETLLVLEIHFQGPLMAMLGLYHVLFEYGISAPNLLDRIMEKGILTGMYPGETIKLFLHNISGIKSLQKYEDVLTAFMTTQILVYDHEPSREEVHYVKKRYMQTGQLENGLAFIKGIQRYKDCNDEFARNMVQEYVAAGIMFPWFENSFPDIRLDEKWRMKQCFEHQSRSGYGVFFYYRHLWQETYTRVQMKPVAFGLYVAYITLFYNECIQYFIEECSESGVKDICMSAVFTKEDSMEQQNYSSLFDCINTVEMCRLMDDYASMEEAIEGYLNGGKQLLENLPLL